MRTETARPKVAVILSLGYTGTTWINLLLGSRPGGFAIGPANRVATLSPGSAEQACLVHESQCDVWPTFVREWDREGNFFEQLARHSGADLLVTNNPREPRLLADLGSPSLDVYYLRVVRDGRACLVSYLRHKSDSGPMTVLDAIDGWLLPRSLDRDGKMPDSAGRGLVLRYEDVLSDPLACLRTAGQFLGVDYPADATRYWEYPQHLTEGNSGTLDLLRRLQGRDGVWHHRQSFYASQREDSVREGVVVDDSWQRLLSRAERLAFDWRFGELHERYGYAREAFAEEETAEFLRVNGLDDAASGDPSHPLSLQARVIAPEDTLPSVSDVGLTKRLLERAGRILRRRPR